MYCKSFKWELRPFPNRAKSTSLQMNHFMKTPIQRQLRRICAGLPQARLQVALREGTSNFLTEDDQALHDICGKCIEASDALVAQLEKVKGQPGVHKRWNSLRQALRSVWSQEDLRVIAKSFEIFKDQLIFHVLLSLRLVMSTF
jgi:hypothetical protein